MNFTGQVYRPPMEAWTPLLEVSYGCSHNDCAFCSMYNNTPFGLAKMEDIEADIKELKERSGGRIKRIYLTGGDPFVLTTDRLKKIAELIHEHIDGVETITAYASLYNLKNKRAGDLNELKAMGYNELYIGIETGYEPALDMINKGLSLSEAKDQLLKLKESGMDYMAILMLGVAGAAKAEENAKASAEFIELYPPKVIAMMTTFIQEGTDLYKLREEGKFKEASIREVLEEQIILLENLDLENPQNILFDSYHMVNQVQIRETLDKKDKIIEIFKEALEKTDPEILDKPNSNKAI